MKRLLAVPVLAGGLSMFLGFVGCGSTEPTVATLGGDAITLGDFERSYAKNNGGWGAGQRSTAEDRQRFLDLLVKFRLKVKEANARGLLQDSSIQAELRGYEQSVAQTYMIEKELVEPAIKTLYDRRKDEVRASHILIKVGENASPEDTLKAWERAMGIIAKLPTQPFDTLAVRYSEDQSVAFNHGDLGYFSTGRMVPVFEDACFNLPVGSVTPTPVRSSFGYHIIKVTGRHPAKGPVRIAHLLLRYEMPADTSALRDTAWSLYRRLRNGEDFAALVAARSQDPGSAARGGEIGIYDRDRLPPDLAELLYSTPVDSVTVPFFAAYGAHIFKVLGFEGVPPFAEAEKELKQQYQQIRYQRDLENYLQGLTRLYRVEYDSSTLNAFATAFDSTLTPADSGWSVLRDTTLSGRRLLSVNGRVRTVGDVVERIGGMDDARTTRLVPASVRSLAKRVGDMLAQEEHARRTPERHPEFAQLMDEYRDGILLYRIEQDEIWQRLTVNDSLLRAFHASRSDQYRWPDRVNFAEIFVMSDSLRDAALTRLRTGEDFLSVAEDMTMRAGYRDKRGVWGLQPYVFNDLATRASKMAVDSVSAPFRAGGGWSIIKVLAKEPPRVKTFEEAGPEVQSAYQEYASKKREAEWIDSLKARYGVVLNTESLQKAFGPGRHAPVE